MANSAHHVVYTDVASKPKARRASDRQRPTLIKEREAFAARVREILGDESTSSFARRCGVREGTIRNLCSAGAWPRTDNLIAIANAGNVLVDWLATGRGPKTPAELKALQAAADQRDDNARPLDQDRLRLAMTMAEDAAKLVGEPVDAARRAELTIAFYTRLEVANNGK